MRLAIVLILISLTSCLNFASDGITVDDARKNYLDHEHAIQDLLFYFREVCPDSLDVSFGLRKENDTYMFGIAQGGTHKGTECEPNSDEMNTYLIELGWSTITIDSLTSKLDRVNCYQISGGDPAKLYYHADDVCSLAYSFYNVAHDTHWLNEIRQQNEKKILNDSTFVNCDCML